MDISIVILDDNPGSLDLLSTALSQPGVIIHTASRPGEALELIREHSPASTSSTASWILPRPPMWC
jgi:CheY-like chemotaxis protein